ncbi:MAG: AAA family ATPase [Chromatiaceae bacterium]
MTGYDEMIDGLRLPIAYPHPVAGVEHIETHISHVFLAGDYAYKIKKPVNLGFLDFSTLERRHFFCREELRLNARLAPRLYLEVVPVTGSQEAPRLGGVGRAFEYAVKMRRFDQTGLLSTRPLEDDLPERVAERVAAFHAAIPAVGEDQAFGTAEAVLGPMLANFEAIRSRSMDEVILNRLESLEAWTRNRHADLVPTLSQRRAEGFVRECHGDMHRGNIALVEGEILIFDGIEFNPALRWIDVQSELAFLLMDLEEAGERGPTRRLLNRYLELTGDYAGLRVLNFYQVYRAMVRAKVRAIRLSQPDLAPEDVERDRRALVDYLTLAEGFTQPRHPCLCLIHGVSGSGKSRLALGLRARLPLIHLRSDIERKRLFGLTAEARTHPGKVSGGIYAADAGERTYGRLLELAGTLLDAGCSPLVDATFLRGIQRAPFLNLARAKGLTCRTLACDAPVEVLRKRINQRAEAGVDPSEAGIEVLEAQLAIREPLATVELALTIPVDTTQPECLEKAAQVLGLACHWRKA